MCTCTCTVCTRTCSTYVVHTCIQELHQYYPVAGTCTHAQKYMGTLGAYSIDARLSTFLAMPREDVTWRDPTAGQVLVCPTVTFFCTQSERDFAPWLLRCVLVICTCDTLLADGDYNSAIGRVHFLQTDGTRWVLGKGCVLWPEERGAGGRYIVHASSVCKRAEQRPIRNADAPQLSRPGPRVGIQAV